MFRPFVTTVELAADHLMCNGSIKLDVSTLTFFTAKQLEQKRDIKKSSMIRGDERGA